MKSDINYQLVAEMISKLETKIDERFDKLECNFVSKTEFAPYRAALNLAGIMFLTSLIGAFIYLVATTPGALAK